MFILPSPVQSFQWPGLSLKSYVKRDDLIHPVISGNKWRKLSGWLEDDATCQKGIVSIGGKWSNHLHALAYLAAQRIFPFTALVVENEQEITTPTIEDIRHFRGDIMYISRSLARELRSSGAAHSFIRENFPGQLFIPEGGKGMPGILGCTTIVQELEILPEYIMVPLGTGTTMAGIIRGSKNTNVQKVIGFSALPKAETQFFEILESLPEDTNISWEIITKYAGKGIGSFSEEVAAFTREFEKSNGILLDKVYNAKMFYGVYQMLLKGILPADAHILCVHTGGIQGNRGL